MARNTVHCDMCGKAFFPHSLPLHVKTCAIKSALIEIPCFYCREEHPKGEMAKHHLKCKEAKKAKGITSQPRLTKTLSQRVSNNTEHPSSSDQTSNRRETVGDGDYVELYGLTAKPEMNGLRGTISGHMDAISGRLCVKIENAGNTSYNLKASSLKLINSNSNKQPTKFAPTGGCNEGSEGLGHKMDCAICGRSFAIDRISIHQV